MISLDSDLVDPTALNLTKIMGIAVSLGLFSAIIITARCIHPPAYWVDSPIRSGDLNPASIEGMACWQG